MNKKGLIGVVGVMVLLLVAVATFLAARRFATFSASPSVPPFIAGTCRDFPEAQLKIGGRKISVALADDEQERHQGLSDCESMPADSGMYFVFPQKEATAFWMKSMHFALDIIWVADGKVTGVVENAPAPVPGTANRNLPQYASNGAINTVLELPAGKAKEYGIKQGTQIELLR